MELENTKKKLKNNTGFFQTNEDRKRGWVWNGYLFKTLGGTEVPIKDNKYDISPGIQNVFVDSSFNTAKSMNDMDKVVFRDLLQGVGYNNRKPTKGRISGRDKYIETNLDNDVRKILNLDTELKGRGLEKIIIPSNIIDIYTTLEVLLGLKPSGHIDFLTEASNLIDELNKKGEIQNERQYRNAPNKFNTNEMELPSKNLDQLVYNIRPSIEEHV